MPKIALASQNPLNTGRWSRSARGGEPPLGCCPEADVQLCAHFGRSADAGGLSEADIAATGNPRGQARRSWIYSKSQSVSNVGTSDPRRLGNGLQVKVKMVEFRSFARDA